MTEVCACDAPASTHQDFEAHYGGIIEPVPLLAGPNGSAWIGDSDGNIQEVTTTGQAFTFPITGVQPAEYVTSMASIAPATCGSRCSTRATRSSLTPMARSVS